MSRLLRAAACLCTVAVLGGSLSGCTTAADAGSSFGDGELISDVAGRLAIASTESYTATYSLGDNSNATIVHNHDPDATAYRYPDGMVLLTPDNATACKTATSPPTCSSVDGNTDETTLPPAIDRTIETGGMIRPETVVAKLNQMARNADAILTESDRTVAGTGETCLSIGRVPVVDRFTACVTTDGLLGAFSGTVNGVTIQIQLAGFTLKTDPTAFALPTALPS